MKITVPQMRSQVEDSSDGIRIVIPPASRAKLLTSILGYALAGYLGFDFFQNPAMRHEASSWRYFFLVVMAFVVLGHVQEWFWLLAGNEVISVSRERLSIRREYFGSGVTRSYAMGQVHNFHYLFPEKKGRTRVPGGVAFLYKGKPVRFGDDLDEAEVILLLDLLRQRGSALGMTELISAVGA